MTPFSLGHPRSRPVADTYIQTSDRPPLHRVHGHAEESGV
jgi:hypothetical protein